MKTLVMKATRPMMAIAIALLGWSASTAHAATPADEHGPYIKNLMSATYRAPIRPAGPREFTKKDIKKLTARAESRQDHLKIARFWEAEANQLDFQASGYEKAAAEFRQDPAPKNLGAPNSAARWEFIATAYRDEARSDRARAASHEGLANETAGL